MTKPSSVSRRHVLRSAATAAVTAGAASLGSSVPLAAQSGPGAPSRGTTAGKKYKAWVRFGTGGGVQELTLRPISGRQVVIRTEAAQACYSGVGQALNNSDVRQATILGHAGVGVVEEVGPQVTRIEVGDRVVVGASPECNRCYQCLNGRADACQALAFTSITVADMANGTPVIQSGGNGGKGGFAEYMVVLEDSCVPVFTKVPAAELSLLACVGGTGLGTAMSRQPVHAGSNVVILGAGPIGLSAVQGARIQGATQIIVVEPIPERRQLALKFGATAALDPNAEGPGLVAKIRDMCKPPTDRMFAGGVGRSWGPDYVIEAVGGDQVPPKVPGPDPTGILPLQQAWDLCPAGGHILTTGIAQKGNVSFAGSDWTNSMRSHHSSQYGGIHPRKDITRFIRLIERGLYDAKSLITTYSLAQTRDAYQAAADRTTIAAVVVFP